MKPLRICTFFALLGALASAAANAQTDSAGIAALTPLARDSQLAYLRTAAPPVITDHATLYVQDESGRYVEAQRGTNGYSCINQRGLNGLSVLPRCDDAASAEALYPTYFLLEQMRAGRATVAAYRDSIREGYSTGRFVSPRHGSFSYMYSTAAFMASDRGQRYYFSPHIMINWPDCKPQDLGVPSAAKLDEVHLGFIDPGTPRCHLIVMTPPVTGITLAK
jgi:hypothetical protein